ncbi:MAG: 3-phosphoshikimate 1-carboxyvinyltransferase [Clostridia bacterium]|nr:3-phosphoshikimate 1-carboxyvinyltransferase [Clostridia bacterium]
MTAEFTPSKARGKVTAPPSKSDTHREIICACLSEGSGRIKNVAFSEDILATLGCMESLGAVITRDEDSVTVLSPVKRQSRAELFCRESGSTLRFLIPLSLMLCGSCTFTGGGRLMSRPLPLYENLSREQIITLTPGENTLEASGELKPGIYRMPGNISSQFISGLLFALPLLGADSRIEIIPPFESRPYIDMTLASLARHGVRAEFTGEYTIEIRGNQKYSPCDTVIEGDWSNAAFLSAFSLAGGDVEVTGLDENSAQVDRVYKEIFESLSRERAVIDLRDCPDLGPVCMAMAFRHGAVFTGTGRLKLKESDRCAAMAQELGKFGIRTKDEGGTFEVFKGEPHAPGGILCVHNDHRIVMALSVLCSITGGKIEGAQAVSKSLPGFFDIIKTLGIKVKLYETA